MNSEKLAGAAGKLLELRGKRVLIATHKNADPDAVASAYVLYRFLSDIKAFPTIIFPEGLNEAAKNMVSGLGILSDIASTVPLDKVFHSLDADRSVIIVDTNNPANLGEYKFIIDNSPEVLVIDHHVPGRYAWRGLGKHHLYILPEYTSNSELIYELLKKQYYMDRLCSTVLLAGILYDTRRFLSVGPRTLHNAAELTEKGGDYRRALLSIAKKMGIAERIARLKAASRMKLVNCNGYIVAITHVSAYEGSAARAIVDLGADLAIVYSIRKDKFRVTMRSSVEFSGKTGISIGRDIAPLLERRLGASGGGHDNAGSIEGSRPPSNLGEVLREYVCRLIRERLKKKAL